MPARESDRGASLQRGRTPATVSKREVAMETAKVFWSGHSQAVRLPTQFRVNAREVRLRRRGKCVILEPVPDSWFLARRDLRAAGRRLCGSSAGAAGRVMAVPEPGIEDH